MNDEQKLESFHRKCIQKIFEGHHNLPVVETVNSNGKKSKRCALNGADFDEWMRKNYHHGVMSCRGQIITKSIKFIGHIIRGKEERMLSHIKTETEGKGKWYSQLQGWLSVLGTNFEEVVSSSHLSRSEFENFAHSLAVRMVTKSY